MTTIGESPLSTVDLLSLQGTRQRSRRLAGELPLLASSIILLGLAAISVLAPEIAPYSYSHSFSRSLAAPSRVHIFGTDNIGRDVFSRVIYGGRLTFAVAVPAVLIALLIGSAVGLVAVYYRGLVDTVIMRIVDILFAFPALLLAITFVAVLGTSTINQILVIAIIFVPGVAVVIRGTALAVREQEFVEAAALMGSKGYRIIFKHLLPNITPVLMIQAALSLSNAVLVEAALSFLGLGPPPPAPSWGAMIGAAESTMTIAPWTVIFPGLAIVLTVLSLNILADELQRKFQR